MGKGFGSKREQGTARHQASIAIGGMTSARQTQSPMGSLNLSKNPGCDCGAVFMGKQSQCAREEKKLRSDRVPHFKRAG